MKCLTRPAAAAMFCLVGIALSAAADPPQKTKLPPNAVEVVDAEALCRAAIADKAAMENKYRGKTIEVSGVVGMTGVNTTDGPFGVLQTPVKEFLLTPWFDRSLEKTVLNLVKGQTISVRGKNPHFTVDKGSGEVWLRLDDCVIVTADADRKAQAKAKAEQQRAARLAENEVKAAGRLAIAREYVNSGKPEKAIELLQKLLADYPDAKAAKEARELLKKLTK